MGCFEGPAAEAEDLGLDLPEGTADESLHYFVMELLEGKSLQDHIEASGSLEEREARRITKVLSEAIDFLHRHGVVHRDVKPGNVMFTSNQADSESLKLIDFS